MSARKIYRPVREVEHLFDAHYRASRPRRRIIRVCGGVRGAGAVGDLARGLYSPLLRPATSTSPRSIPPPCRNIPFSLCPVLRTAVSLLLISNRVLFSRLRRLPTTCEGDGAAAWLYESRPLAGTLHSVCIVIVLIACPHGVPLPN